MAKKSGSNRSQTLIILGFTVLMFASVGITSFAVLKLRSSGDGGGEYRSVTMTDAYLDCETRLKKELGKSLNSYGPDNLSTRYSEKRERFLVFFKAQVKAKNNALVDNYVTCEVSKGGSIQQFHVALESSTGEGVERKEKGNPFGYTF